MVWHKLDSLLFVIDISRVYPSSMQELCKNSCVSIRKRGRQSCARYMKIIQIAYPYEVYILNIKFRNVSVIQERRGENGQLSIICIRFTGIVTSCSRYLGSNFEKTYRTMQGMMIAMFFGMNVGITGGVLLGVTYQGNLFFCPLPIKCAKLMHLLCRFSNTPFVCIFFSFFFVMLHKK